MPTFTTFRKINEYETTMLKRDEPGLYFGEVCVTKFRVTIVPVDEPVEVIHRRIIELWETNTNPLWIGPLRRAAEELKCQLPQETEG